MTEGLAWRPGGAVIVQVDPSRIPRVALPPEATLLHEDGQPAFHVTLIRRATLAPVVDVLAEAWPEVVERAGPPPPLRLDPTVRRGTSAAKQSTGWYLDVRQPEAWHAYKARVAAAIDAALRRRGAPGFVDDDHDRHFHLTLANDRGGDPMRSPSQPHRDA